MGIPAYYKRLTDTVRGLVRKNHPNGGKVGWLWLDFNCMIYHCLRRPGIGDSYPGESGRSEWEGHFIEEIVKYLERVVREVGPSEGVFIGIDGVVPMAKMRQQRLRRFKSAWLAEMGIAEGQEAGRARWDTNAITPGTKFMDNLQNRLVRATSERRGGGKVWELSGWDEAGEGEHKIMERWRSGRYGIGEDGWAVYGLDADLIVLSLLNKKRDSKIWLFREMVESGSIVRDAGGEELFSWFDIGALEQWLEMVARVDRIDYCFAMSFLGNDFLPSSLAYKMRDDGHNAIVKILTEAGVKLVGDEGKINWKGVYELFGLMAVKERERVEKFIEQKMEQGRACGEKDLGQNNWPLGEQVESCLVGRKGKLVADWEEVWRKRFLAGVDKGRICSEYYRGMQWVWDYYNGRQERVCFNWCWPWGAGPLWQWLAVGSGSVARVEPKIRREDIRPTEQLCLVLPPQSWWLVEEVQKKNEASLRRRAPWLFPSSFGFESVGRRYFWECEPEIPVPSIMEIKAILA